MTGEPSFGISQLAREFDVTPRALRFYEDKGLLSPRREGLSRVYSHKDRAKLQLIVRGKKVGLSLIEIKELLDLYKVDQRAQAQVALKRFNARIVALEEQRRHVEDAIDALADIAVESRDVPHEMIVGEIIQAIAGFDGRRPQQEATSG